MDDHDETAAGEPAADPAAARAALAHVEHLAARTRAEAGWLPPYLAFFAVAFGGITLELGLVRPLWLRMVLFSVVWPLVVTGAVLWVRRRAAAPRDAGRRMAPYWIGTAAFYGIALFAGTPRLLGVVAFWVPAALVVAAPLALGAWRERAR